MTSKKDKSTEKLRKKQRFEDNKKGDKKNIGRQKKTEKDEES